MIKVENIEVYGFDTAIRGMRAPKQSWNKSDSGYIATGEHYENVYYVVGPNDLDLMKRLVRAGVEHRTFCRLIQVSMDITAPLYWWKEADRYTVGKSQISTSTMHTIHKKEFKLDDFSHEHLLIPAKLETVIRWLNDYRKAYITWQDGVMHQDDYGNQITRGDIWYQMIQLLPSSYNQKRSVLMSYEVALKMIRERENHKLDEWRHMVSELKKLPYVEELISEVQ